MSQRHKLPLPTEYGEGLLISILSDVAMFGAELDMEDLDSGTDWIAKTSDIAFTAINIIRRQREGRGFEGSSGVEEGLILAALYKILTVFTKVCQPVTPILIISTSKVNIPFSRRWYENWQRLRKKDSSCMHESRLLGYIALKANNRLHGLGLHFR